jgi:tetratricopeptide (TPR) repeat protein
VTPSADPPAARGIRTAAEAVLFGLVAFSPWPFASVEPAWEFVLLAGVFVLACLWAAHATLTRRFSYHPDLASACLLGLVLLTAVQLLPLPQSVVRALSPQAAEWHQTLIPETPELLPGESDADAPRRSDPLPLSIDPSTTRDFLVRLLAVFLAYAVTRNLVASGGSFRRLAWVGFATGVLLAVVALGQCTSGSRSTIYGVFESPNQAFGPFVNKNHYPFFISLCAGLGLGLLLLEIREGGSVGSPRVAGLLAGLGLMLVSIPFSLSRGGVVATLAAVGVTAAVGLPGRRRGLLLVGLGLVTAGLAVWLGMTPTGITDDRTPLWRKLWPIAERFPLTGTGGGTLPRAELAFRDETMLTPLVWNSAANEYLEAAIEGGVVRVGLTVTLAIGLVWSAAAGWRRLRGRPAGPLLLGGLYGLTAVAVHSVVDFGLHAPAVALLAAVVAAQVSGNRKPETRDTNRGNPVSGDPARGDDGRAILTLTGPSAIAAGLVVLLIGLFVAWAGWRSVVVDRLRTAAARVSRSSAPDRWDRSIRFLEAATRLRPDDAGLWNELSAAHLSAANERAAPPFVAAAGPVAAVWPPDAVLPEDVPVHVVPALTAARTARDRCPLLAGPHLRLGAYARTFARCDPPAAYFDRAKRVAGYDPDAWYLSGAAALANGEPDRAWADWRESLRRSPRRLGPVVRLAVAAGLSPEQIRTRVLPDDPAVWVAAADVIFANPTADPGVRQVWFRVAVERWRTDAANGRFPETLDGWEAWATAEDELNDPPAALAVWRLAAVRHPDDPDVRDRLAARLEAEELYAEAVPHLHWLTTRRPDRANYRDRLDAARHALELQRWIDGR